MKHYQEITLLSDEGISTSFLLSKVFTQIHIAIVTQKNKNDNIPYGISFPEYNDVGLGNKIRVFSDTAEHMNELHLKDKYLSRLCDYVHIVRTRAVPIRIKGYAMYKRIHVDNSVETQARRFSRRHNVSYEEALKEYDKKQKNIKLPYVILNSLTTGRQFSLFIKKEYTQNKTSVLFNAYGLSKGGAIPEF